MMGKGSTSSPLPDPFSSIRQQFPLTDKEISEKKEHIKDLVRDHYARAQTYATVVIAGSYAAFFTSWNGFQEHMAIADKTISLVSMIFSLLLYVIWEIFKMIFEGKSMQKQMKIADLPNAKFLEELKIFNERKQQLSDSLIVSWYLILIWTIMPAIVGVIFLIKGIV